MINAGFSALHTYLNANHGKFTEEAVKALLAKGLPVMMKKKGAVVFDTDIIDAWMSQPVEAPKVEVRPAVDVTTKPKRKYNKRKG